MNEGTSGRTAAAGAAPGAQGVAARPVCGARTPASAVKTEERSVSCTALEPRRGRPLEEGVARAGAAINAAPVRAVKVESGADLNRRQQPREGGEVPLGISVARRAVATVLLAGILAACGAATVDNAAAERAYREHRSQVEVTVQGQVARLFPDRQGPAGMHEKFLLRLPSGLTLEIEDNIDIAPRAPVQEGDTVTIHGEYVWKQTGGLIHYTHHDPRGRHEGGWIEVGGKRYQ